MRYLLGIVSRTSKVWNLRTTVNASQPWVSTVMRRPWVCLNCGDRRTRGPALRPESRSAANGDHRICPGCVERAAWSA